MKHLLLTKNRSRGANSGADSVTQVCREVSRHHRSPRLPKSLHCRRLCYQNTASRLEL